MLLESSRRFSGWQPCAQANGSVALPLPFCRGWAGGHGLLQCSGSVASATVCFFTLHTSLMAMLHFSKEELKKAFLKFSKIYSRSNSGPTHIKEDFLLYAIYAVECGLKFLFLKNRGIHTTDRLAEDDLTSIKTHDLNSLLRGVRMNGKFPQFRRMKSRQSVSSEKFHELYRYGGRLDSECEKNLMQILSSITNEIQNNLRG